jgi:hypothetical protein
MVEPGQVFYVGEHGTETVMPPPPAAPAKKTAPKKA